uniref:Predicted protein n=1 Tax=Physcomitrium patens TaxID=3218 RepID=A9TMH1_PHYPA
MPTVQSSTSLSKKADMGMEEIIRGMRDLQIKLARLEENTSTNNLKNVSKQGYHETAARESASYGTRVDDDLGGSMETSEFWASAISTIQEGKLPREALLRIVAIIRGATGWEDLVESLSVHAYIAKSQHEVLMEEKRRGNFDDTREGNSSKRQTRGDKAREAPSQELPIEDTSASLEEKTRETKDKDKLIAYKLLSDIEAATNLKGVLEERILNAKVEFTLKEVLEIIKNEFYDIIIESIKRKRQLMGETGMSHAIDARIYKDEEEVDIGYKQPTNEKNGYNQRVGFKVYSDKEIETLSHYTQKHWTRATTEVLVKVGDIEEPIVALVDHGSEINLMSKDLYKKQKWPIDMEYGWAIRAANNTWGELYRACPDVKIRIGDVVMEQHFFVQDTTSYPLILGQPYSTATRMETKVLDDDTTHTRIRSEDGRKVVQFLTVPPNHERNRDRLREKPLPKIVERFKDFGEEVLSRDEGAFDASFIGILDNGNIMYKKVDDFKRKERKRLYNIEGELCKLGPQQVDESDLDNEGDEDELDKDVENIF